jgi:hypothetical protein
MHNEELFKLYASPNITTVVKSRTMRWSGHVARMGQIRRAYDIFIEKPKGKRLERTRRR